jgi:hypothetical protein
MKQSQSSSSSHCGDQILRAENELSAFIAAVTELFGPEQARLSANDWLDELELIAGPPPFTTCDWRTVTIAASARLATRLNVALEHRISPGTSTTDTKVSPIPLSNSASAARVRPCARGNYSQGGLK